MQVSNMIMSHRERSAQEAAFLVTGLALKGSNTKTVFVNTHDKLKRTRILRKECINNFDKVYEADDFASDIHDKYVRRPLVLEDSCLAEFAQYWRTKQPTKIKANLEEQSSESEDENVNEELTLLNSRTIIVKRRNLAVLKTPFHSHIRNPDDYYYSLILLYFPFRDESTLLSGHTNPFDRFRELYDQLRPNAINLHADMIVRQEELQRALQRLNLLREDANEGIEDLDDIMSSDEENAEAAEVEYGQDNLNGDPEIPIVSSMALNERIEVLNTEHIIIANIKIQT